MRFFQYLTEVTNAYKAHLNDAPALREAYCIEIMNRYAFLPPQENDLIAGRKRVVEVGFSNEPLLGRSVCWFYDEARSMEALERENATIEEIEKAKEMLAFWKEHETRKNLRDTYPDDVKEAMPYDIYWEHSQISFPLYRVVGAYMDYDKLLKNGLGGLRKIVEDYREVAKKDNKDTSLYDGCLIALNSCKEVCLWYADEADKMGKTQMANDLRAVSEDKPKTFTQALQLHWIYSLISGVLNYGRMDDFMGDYLVNDINNGIITEEKALDYLCSLWTLVDARKTVFHGRIIIGGKGRHNEKAADLFAKLAIKASDIVAEMEPQLSLRFYEGQNPELMDLALSVIGKGKVYPMLYNDDVNIPAVEKAFEISTKEAEDYCFFGCGEYVINHKSMGSPNGIINLLKALETTIFNGEDLRDGKKIGLSLGSLTDYETFDDLMNAYKEQVTSQFKMLALLEKMEYDFCAKEGAFLYISMLMDDCLERGKSVCGGGVKYLGGTLETYGNINTTNSLYAIKTMVYDKKLISKETLMKALRADFEGYETERKLLMSAEKYGNDSDGIDTFAQEFHDFVCNSVRDLKDYNGLHSYMVVIINNEANTVLGRFTCASADGRHANQPMANANNPAGGTDKNGITAMLNSLSKLRTDIHAGAVQNLTFSRDLFQNKELVKQLLDVYFANGGQQAMINVLHRGELDDAMVHPELHQNLMVRVGGFSARFVTLSPDVQREIASRTLY